MPTRTETFDPNELWKIEIFHNRNKYRESSISKVLKKSNADIIFNGTIYSPKTLKPLTYVKSNGVYLCNPGYLVYGFCWNGPRDFACSVIPTGKQNEIACTPLIVNSVKLNKLNYQPDMGGKRQRTAIGKKNGRIAYYVSTVGYTPENLRDYLSAIGWSDATMLDGGGSVCYADKSGYSFISDRKRIVPHFIAIYKKKEDNFEPEAKKPMVEINAYSKKSQGNKKLSTNFTVKEFACNDGSDAILIAPRLVMILQSVRSYFNKPVTINSAYRTPQYNKQVGGVTNSQHCYGTAADIAIKGVTPTQVANYVRTLMPDWGGVGIYSTFTHVDVRETKSDWKG